MSSVSLAMAHLKSYEQAVVWSRRAIEANRNHPLVYLYLAAALGQLDRLAEAHSAVEAALGLNPDLTISRGLVLMRAASDDPTYLAQIESLFDGLRKAGLPEE
jgi:tetratricopeptide (TPR) repeat protein